MNKFQYPTLSQYQRSILLRHAKKVLAAQQKILQYRPGETLVHYTLQQQERHQSLKHYPKGDRIDHQTGAQYFYHCHRENMQSMEHGHFHCFIRYPQIPARIKPAPLDDWDKYIDNPMTHLVALSLNHLGEPIRLFTVNRWVTSEIWYPAKQASQLLNRFKITLQDDAHWRVLDEWINAILQLFSPQIKWLHRARDLKIEAYMQKKLYFKNNSIYNDESIEELSEIQIDLKQQIQWLLETLDE